MVLILIFCRFEVNLPSGIPKIIHHLGGLLSPPSFLITFMVDFPIDPVDPSIAIFFLINYKDKLII